MPFPLNLLQSFPIKKLIEQGLIQEKSLSNQLKIDNFIILKKVTGDVTFSSVKLGTSN